MPIILHIIHMKKWSEVKWFSRVQLFVTPWTVAYQAYPSMGFSRQEYWSGLPFPSPGDLPNPGIEPWSPALQADAVPSEPQGKSCVVQKCTDTFIGVININLFSAEREKKENEIGFPIIKGFICICFYSFKIISWSIWGKRLTFIKIR